MLSFLPSAPSSTIGNLQLGRSLFASHLSQILRAGPASPLLAGKDENKEKSLEPRSIKFESFKEFLPARWCPHKWKEQHPWEFVPGIAPESRVGGRSSASRALLPQLHSLCDSGAVACLHGLSSHLCPRDKTEVDRGRPSAWLVAALRWASLLTSCTAWL